MKDQKKYIFSLVLLTCAGLAFFLAILTSCQQQKTRKKETYAHQPSSSETSEVKTARIMAHGDLLYHDLLYWSARQPDGTYDFTNNFTYVKPWIEQADLAIADFEGTISAEHPLSGYPLFNAPAETAKAIAEAGYHVVDLAHNHILDSGLSGLISTAQTFKAQGVDSVGVYPEGDHAQAKPYIREVNGIKVAILAYTYGFNELEKELTADQQAAYLSSLDEKVIQRELAAAEKLADLTIVMPQMGVEYQLEPTAEQKALYHQMVDWGADIIFGGHPHVPEPAEVVNKDGDKKLIVYSMGNFLSNQRIETMAGVANAKWTERGVLMDVTIEKTGDKTVIKTAKARPSWVSRVATGATNEDGYPLYDYKTFIMEDFLAGQPYRDWIDAETQARLDAAYAEMNDLMGLNWE